MTTERQMSRDMVQVAFKERAAIEISFSTMLSTASLVVAAAVVLDSTLIMAVVEKIAERTPKMRLIKSELIKFNIV